MIGDQNFHVVDQNLMSNELGQIQYGSNTSSLYVKLDTGEMVDTGILFRSLDQESADASQMLINRTENNLIRDIGNSDRSRGEYMPLDMSNRMISINEEDLLQTRPLQVQDNEDYISFDWDPINDQMLRIQKKLNSLAKNEISQPHLGHLRIFEGELFFIRSDIILTTVATMVVIFQILLQTFDER